MTSVLIVDDQALVRAGIRSLLEHDPDLDVVGEAVDGRTAISQAVALRPDVILMDIRMPGVDGLTATAEIAADPALASTRIVILTTFDDDDDIIEAIMNGAAGYLLKDTPADELRAAVRTAAAGENRLSPSIARRVMEHVARSPAPMRTDPRLEALSDREREVLERVAEGDTNDEIAAALHLSPATARTYVSRLLSRLGARDRTALAILAHRSGIVDHRTGP
jgi:DNA-binding NarL/FixJ family response regulator